MHEGDTGTAVARVDETPRDECGEPELVGPAFRSEPAPHDRERALRTRAVDGSREGEVGSEAVVTRVVVELDPHAEEPLVSAELERGAHLGGDGVVTAL